MYYSLVGYLFLLSTYYDHFHVRTVDFDVCSEQNRVTALCFQRNYRRANGMFTGACLGSILKLSFIIPGLNICYFFMNISFLFLVEGLRVLL